MGVTSLVEQTLRQRIDSGDLPPGAKLPSERTLAADFQVGRTTVRLVLTRLTAEGLVRAEQGRGYFVTAAEEDE